MSKENVLIIGELPARKSYVGKNRKYMRLKVEIDANEPPWDYDMVSIWIDIHSSNFESISSLNILWIFALKRSVAFSDARQKKNKLMK